MIDCIFFSVNADSFSGVFACEKSRSDACKVTSSFVRNDNIVDTSTLNGDGFLYATCETEGSVFLYRAFRNVFISEFQL